MNLVHSFLGISLGEKALLLSKDWEEWRVCFVMLGMQEEVSQCDDTTCYNHDMHKSIPL